ncbi:histidine kinase [Paenibacillus qinlingensis]|uniref:Two-component system sensor histidine kinase YesM n=1 Tax=Paenibacillus qinlingensis TaxID=1837343 RepID=A0ABU1NYI2_9BACL|nr:histidine kinase [Paenibacillus qinlingensis]MDR6551887.1 two-component system sensor histidine kinase YesM [Paenibacillus qinlingensis]
MFQRIRRLWPAKLQNRIFLTFLLVIFIPFSILQIHNYNQIETIIGEKISEQNVIQLGQMKSQLDELRLTALNSVLQIERNSSIPGLIAVANRSPGAEQTRIVEEKLDALKSTFLPNSVYIQYTLGDEQGRAYTSLPLAENNEGPQHIRMAGELSAKLPLGGSLIKWEFEQVLSGTLNETKRKNVLSLYSLSQVSGGAWLRVHASVDIDQWLLNSASGIQVKQNYYMVDQQGKVISQTNTAFAIDPVLKLGILNQGKMKPNEYTIDKSGQFVYNATYVPSISSYLVSQFPLDFFFGDIQALKRQVFLTYLLIIAFFIGISFLTLSTLTRPLRLLETRMKEAAEKRMNIKQPEHPHRGEILSFVRAFNGMVDDVTGLIGQLKLEERQKEAIRFQMLLTQMNPHFLLNTINTIKWTASNAGNETTVEMCKALAKLLESSLNTDRDLVFLQDELQLLQSYVYIQSFRYDHRFEVQYDVQPDLNYALVPKLSLQPLVENAIQHGLVYRKQGGIIKVTVASKERFLLLDVQDNGVGMQNHRTDMPRARKGIGISNLKERLSLLYKDEGKLELIPQEEGTHVRIFIPLLLSNPYQPEHIE